MFGKTLKLIFHQCHISINLQYIISDDEIVINIIIVCIDMSRLINFVPFIRLLP